MKEHFENILSLQEDCARLCLELKGCLEREQLALIQLKMEDIVQNNHLKESLLGQLSTKKAVLRRHLKEVFGVEKAEELDSLLPPDMKKAWQESRTRWLKVWESSRDNCERNQKFMRHSLKNMGLLLENLKRLLGENSLYSAKGTRVDLPNHGKVVEASY